MEYVPGGDLLTLVRGQKGGRLKEGVARRFVRQLVSALHHMHEHGIVHRWENMKLWSSGLWLVVEHCLEGKRFRRHWRDTSSPSCACVYIACLMSARCSSNVGQGIRSQNCKWKWRRILTFLHRNVCLIKTYCQIFHSSSLQIVIILKCFFFFSSFVFFFKRITLTERYR